MGSIIGTAWSRIHKKTSIMIAIVYTLFQRFDFVTIFFSFPLCEYGLHLRFILRRLRVYKTVTVFDTFLVGILLLRTAKTQTGLILCFQTIKTSVSKNK